MKKKNRRSLLMTAGIVSTGLGAMFAFPGFLKEQYGLAVAASLLLVAGLVLLSISFGD